MIQHCSLQIDPIFDRSSYVFLGYDLMMRIKTGTGSFWIKVQDLPMVSFQAVMTAREVAQRMGIPLLWEGVFHIRGECDYCAGSGTAWAYCPYRLPATSMMYR